MEGGLVGQTSSLEGDSAAKEQSARLAVGYGYVAETIEWSDGLRVGTVSGVFKEWIDAEVVRGVQDVNCGHVKLERNPLVEFDVLEHRDIPYAGHLVLRNVPRNVPEWCSEYRLRPAPIDDVPHIIVCYRHNLSSGVQSGVIDELIGRSRTSSGRAQKRASIRSEYSH